VGLFLGKSIVTIFLLQLIKCWTPRAAGRRSAAGANICGSALLQPARRVCVSLSAFFILILFVAQTASLTTMMLTGGNFNMML